MEFQEAQNTDIIEQVIRCMDRNFQMIVQYWWVRACHQERYLNQDGWFSTLLLQFTRTLSFILALKLQHLITRVIKQILLEAMNWLLPTQVLKVGQLTIIYFDSQQQMLNGTQNLQQLALHAQGLWQQSNSLSTYQTIKSWAFGAPSWLPWHVLTWRSTLTMVL